MVPPLLWMSRTVAKSSLRHSWEKKPFYPYGMLKTHLTPLVRRSVVVISRSTFLSPGHSPPHVTTAAKTSMTSNLMDFAGAGAQPLAEFCLLLACGFANVEDVDVSFVCAHEIFVVRPSSEQQGAWEVSAFQGF